MRQQAKKNYDVYLVGAGLSEVPATAAWTTLAGGPRPSLMMGHGYYGYEPGGGRSNPDASSALLTTDATTLYGTILGGRPGAALAILGAGQVDRHGNLNSTLIDGQLLTGSGGSNDAAATCDVVLVTRLSRKKLVDEVEFITCPGSSVMAVITECGIFIKDEHGELMLASQIDVDGIGPSALYDKLVAACGWTLRTAPSLLQEALPSNEEIALIRSLMPARYE